MKHLPSPETQGMYPPSPRERASIFCIIASSLVEMEEKLVNIPNKEINITLITIFVMSCFILKKIYYIALIYFRDVKQKYI